MKNKISLLFRILLIVVLVGKILNWFLKFDAGTNQILNTAMFCLIGIAYIVMGFVWDKKLAKVLMVFCGIFLIIMNFIPQTTLINIIGILCMLFPLIIARFHKEKDSSELLLEN